MKGFVKVMFSDSDADDRSSEGADGCGLWPAAGAVGAGGGDGSSSEGGDGLGDKERQRKRRRKKKKKEKKKKTISGSTSSSASTYETLPLETAVALTRADHDAILAHLRSMKWDECKNTSRRNVIREDASQRTPQGKPYCRSFIFGRNMKDPQGRMSWWSTEYPEQYKAMRDLVRKYVPGFRFSHITVNKSLRCKRHRDRGNAGPSLIAGFGPFHGGRLIVERPGGGQPEVAHDIKGKLVSFNGATQPHETAPFTGERYTLVWYQTTIQPAAPHHASRAHVKGSETANNKLKAAAAALRARLKNKRKTR